MKTIIYILVISMLAVSTKAQLANTKWKTTFQLDQPTDVVFNFSADTLNVTDATDTSNILESMKYSIQDTVLSIQKLFGQSECDTATTGTYSCKITGNEMWLKLISDDCSDRSNVIKDIKLTGSE